MNQRRLFIASCLSLVVTAMIFALRGNVEDLILTDPALEGFFSATGSRAEYGWLSTMAFFGFASSILVASPMLDGLGMRNLLYLAFGLHIIGIIGFIGAPSYTVMSVASLLAGFGNGLVEAVINPLIATLYPEEKTHKLNVLHAWWPGGLIIGGLLGFALSRSGVGWQIQLGIILIPTIIYGILIFGQKFPLTERVASGISTGEMIRAALRPGFLLLLLCMMITASIELALTAVCTARASVLMSAASSTNARPADGVDSRALRRRTAASWLNWASRALPSLMRCASCDAGPLRRFAASCSSRAAAALPSRAARASLVASARFSEPAAPAIASRSAARLAADRAMSRTIW